jgi:uracil phosphoribosyltransferase/adenylate kinase/phosphoserine phosphatase
MPANYKDAKSNIPGSMVNSQLNEVTPKFRSASGHKAAVIGLYGIPGSGKTALLNQLRQELGQTHFTFYEGSQMIATVVPGGLDAFQNMEEQEKARWRRRAIDSIGKNAADSGQVAVVAGHFMFWPEEQGVGRPVYTQNDFETFTHILYLDIPAEVVAQRCQDDTERSRPFTSAGHLRKWQQEEKAQLRDLCRRHGVLFSLLSPDPMLLNKVLILLHDFRFHTEKYNLSQAESRLDDVVVASQGQLETMLVLDADRTLAAADTGTLFWERISGLRPLEREVSSTLKALFSSPLGHSYTAFRQAVLLYEETANDQEFDALCQDVALAVNIHPEFVSLLQLVGGQNHIGAVVVTCGLRRVWDKVLEREGLSEKVRVIGGGRIADGFVVSEAVKGALVARLREAYHMRVWAFGDSPLDLDMLRKADRAFIVVGEAQTRSKTMDAALRNAIDYGGLRAHQAVLPSNASPRLDTTKLPVVKLTEPEFVKSLLGDRYTQDGLRVLGPIDTNAAKLLATPMRNAAVGGPDLREAHRRAGWYLAMGSLADVVGLEPSSIRHVLGRQTRGNQLLHEQQTTIVALMRGGEPMASGVSDAFPRAMFVHAGGADDIKRHHLQGQLTVILVDSVVNTGKSIAEFVEHVRKLHATIRIVVVAGVIQAQCVSGGSLNQTFARHANLHLIALRLSDTKFTGSGTTDTGNRLFNTTHLP